MLPGLPERPGIYRFIVRSSDGLDQRFYVGESDNLSRRMGNYRNPGQTQPTNVRLHTLLVSTLGAGGSAEVAVVLEATLCGEPLDLSTRPGPIIVENVALVELVAAGSIVENL